MLTSFGEDYSGDESDAVPENQSFEHQIAANTLLVKMIHVQG